MQLPIQNNNNSKALLWILATVICLDVYADCPVFTSGAAESVAKIVDGDTIHLTNGTKVRLAGINTMELGHGAKADDPNSQEAKDLLEKILIANGRQVRLEPSEDKWDHYGRLIAHAYINSGGNIQEKILRAGLALGYAHPPNLEHLDCYREAETQARQQSLGLWRSPALSADTLADDTKGFNRVQGTVQNVKHTRKSILIKLSERMAVRVAQDDMPLFATFDFTHLTGKNLEVRGYVHTYKDKLQMRIRHPADILILN